MDSEIAEPAHLVFLEATPEAGFLKYLGWFLVKPRINLQSWLALNYLNSVNMASDAERGGVGPGFLFARSPCHEIPKRGLPSAACALFRS